MVVANLILYSVNIYNFLTMHQGTITMLIEGAFVKRALFFERKIHKLMAKVNE